MGKVSVLPDRPAAGQGSLVDSGVVVGVSVGVGSGVELGCAVSPGDGVAASELDGLDVGPSVRGDGAPAGLDPVARGFGSEGDEVAPGCGAWVWRGVARLGVGTTDRAGTGARGRAP